VAIVLQPVTAASRQLAYRIMVLRLAGDAGSASTIIGCILPILLSGTGRSAPAVSAPATGCETADFNYSMDAGRLLVILFDYFISLLNPRYNALI
jgi:hypothetical protein